MNYNFKSVLFFVLTFISLSLFAEGYLPAFTLHGFVKSVVDGDTAHITGTDGKNYKIRFVGIDTAETNYNQQSQGYWGEAARNYLAQLLPVGAPVVVVTGPNPYDANGRVLGRILINGNDVNRKMLETGMAAIYTIYPFDATITQDYIQVAAQAMASRQGMFCVNNPIPELPYMFRLRIGNRKPDKFVGDYTTKRYYKPEYHTNIPVPLRIFFFTEQEAIDAKYIRAY